jgi:hypothetical protein
MYIHFHTYYGAGTLLLGPWYSDAPEGILTLAKGILGDF